MSDLTHHLLTRQSQTPRRSESRLVGLTTTFAGFKNEWTEQAITKCFQRQVRKFPARTAVKSSRYELTFRELNRAANRLAWAILSRRDETPEPILLLFEHDAPMVAAILGVLKAGKFYVALDPSYPTERNRYILDDSQAALIVTNNNNLNLATRLIQNRTQLINIDQLEPGTEDEDPHLKIAPDDLAYILYTSGSSGQPKGVVHTHRTALHKVLRHSNGRQLSPADRIALFFSYSFGASVGNVFGALLNGAALFPFDIKQEGLTQIASWLIAEEITLFHTVPTVFRHFTATLTGKEHFPRLRLIELAGETIHRKDLELYQKYFEPHCVLHLGMGTGETGRILQYTVDRQTAGRLNVVPTGYPTEDMKVVLLDEEGREVDGTDIGEIAVKSRYLSLGYWRRPELTSAAFRADPDGGSERMYLTGDLGQRLPDGCLVHLGRKDSQVKIRGARVELVEIEMALLEISGINEAVVVAREEVGAEKRLVAYLVADAKGAPDVSELQRLLKKKLPDYMVPWALVMLDALPLLPNGKVDRRALPIPSNERPALVERFVAPHTPFQAKLAEIWRAVLDLRQVGIRDDFFQLGGHSLLAARLFAEIEKRFQRRLPLSSIFTAPTVEQLALLLNEPPASPATSCVVALQEKGSFPPLFCVAGFGAMFNFRHLALHLGDNQPVYALQFPGLDGQVEPLSTIEATATEFIRQMQVLEPAGPYYLCGLCGGGLFAYEIAQQLYRSAQPVGLLIMLDTFVPGFGRPKNNKQKRRKQQKDLESSLIHSPSIDRVRDVNHKAVRRYLPEPYPGRIILLRPMKRSWEADPLNGWGPLINGGIETYAIEGHHRHLFKEPMIRITAANIRSCLLAAHGRRDAHHL